MIRNGLMVGALGLCLVALVFIGIEAESTPSRNDCTRSSVESMVEEFENSEGPPTADTIARR